MSNIINSQEVFTTTRLGLLKVFNEVYSANPQGITKDNIANYSNFSLTDKTFVQLLTENFTTFDVNKDGKLTKKEFDRALQQISLQGMTQEQIMSLADQSAFIGNKTLLNTVLAHFNDIDKNKDGRVTSDEINSYQVEKQVYQQDKDYRNNMVSDMTVFYGDDTSTSSSNSSSVLDSRYSDSSSSS